jgi:hypothetical protein
MKDEQAIAKLFDCWRGAGGGHRVFFAFRGGRSVTKLDDGDSRETLIVKE